MKMDKIGIYRGKPISDMTRDELLEFVDWICKKLVVKEKELADLEAEYRDLQLEMKEELN